MDPDTARFAVKQGADYIGLLFSKKSTRAIGLEKAKEIVETVKESEELGANPADEKKLKKIEKKIKKKS